MPTPSSNSPPESRPPVFDVFPSCPDDVAAHRAYPLVNPAGSHSNAVGRLGSLQTPARDGLAEPARQGYRSDDSLSNSSSDGELTPVAATVSGIAFHDAAATAMPTPTTIESEPESTSLSRSSTTSPSPSPLVRSPTPTAIAFPSANKSWPVVAGADKYLDRHSWYGVDGARDGDIDPPFMPGGFPNVRVAAVSPCSYLRPGSKFRGIQKSERQVYQVEVDIKHVDLQESFLCGYLRIQGLTPEHPSLTTYFEGEIIGPKYGFSTDNPSWGANERIDHNHWSKFNAFRPFTKQVRRSPNKVLIPDVTQHEHIFMRWKELFLVPDHRVRTIIGASFEGFYYICFNQLRGEVSGIYFHSKSEKFQQLELRHVEDKGCLGAMEFR